MTGEQRATLRRAVDQARRDRIRDDQNTRLAATMRYFAQYPKQQHRHRTGPPRCPWCGVLVTAEVACPVHQEETG